MSFSKIKSAQNTLLEPHLIDIEIDLSKGLHSFSIVGLPDKAVEESRDRISAAIKNSGFASPKSKNQKIVIALAPADVKKEGPNFDLGMAIGYLLAEGELVFDPKEKLFLGELSLDGNLRKISGVLPLVKHAKAKGLREVFVPEENAKEAALIGGIKIYGAKNLKGVADHLRSESLKNSENKFSLKLQPQTEIIIEETETSVDFSDIKGQEGGKRGLEIAAAGGHNVLMYGPPGTGKTMLAKAFSGILPSLSNDEILEVTAIHSVAGALKDEIIYCPPFRSPHHTASYVSLVGGGATPKPGEITLAHRGVLFLDEFPEFDRRVIDSLRQPLEERTVSVSRAKGTAHFPANFILVAAMNPCPCGNFGIKGKPCTCPPINIDRYRRKISGPILDRIDITVEVSKINHEDLSNNLKTGEKSADVRKRILKAREIQKKRFEKTGKKIFLNSQMSARDIITHIKLGEPVKKLLIDSAQRLDLSARAYHRIIKLARTIADLEGKEEIAENHILEALQYRPKKQLE